MEDSEKQESGLVITWLALSEGETKTARLGQLSEQTGCFTSLSRCLEWQKGVRHMPPEIHNQMLLDVLVAELKDEAKARELWEKMRILK